MTLNTKSLSGLSILVTRPQHQADSFCQMLEDAGASVIRFPVIQIEATQPDKQTVQRLEHLEQQDIILFTSSNAVHFALPWLTAYINQPPASQPPFKIGAIGKKTASDLQQLQLDVDILPESRFNSESLLALPEMQSVGDKNILIIKGKAGRSLLKDTLQARGADVNHADVYYRQRPTVNALMLDTLKSQKIDIITLTSAESSENLFALLKDQSIPWLTNASLLLGSKRIHQAIDTHSTQAIWIADNPGDDAMFKTLHATINMEEN